jgi:hypothetical protein
LVSTFPRRCRNEWPHGDGVTISGSQSRFQGIGLIRPIQRIVYRKDQKVSERYHPIRSDPFGYHTFRYSPIRSDPSDTNVELETPTTNQTATRHVGIGSTIARAAHPSPSPLFVACASENILDAPRRAQTSRPRSTSRESPHDPTI